jgi:FMN-dependent NADH-azoreductase
MYGKTIRKVLRIDSSARRDDSVSRALGDEVVRRLISRNPGLIVSRIDLADGMEHIDGDWVGANFTAAEQRDLQQRENLSRSDAAVAALREADAVVLTAPIYNFSVPSTLKAWIDHVCRAGLTFNYTGNGPQGLLEDRTVYLAMASGGVPFGSATDFASGYLKQVFRFIGIEDVRLIGAERVAVNAAEARHQALATLEKWLPDPAGQVA